MLKIAGGSLRGRPLIAPRGEQTRPTSGQARAALFNILGQRCDGWTVLDLFAGSGALGFEALSRGAQAVVFVESHRLALDALRKNSALLGLENSIQILPQPVQQALSRCRGPFDLILADPPYHLQIAGQPAAQWTLHEVDRLKLAQTGGWVVVEAGGPPGELVLSHLRLVDVRTYGDTCLWILRSGPPAAQEDPDSNSVD